ncbi:hypothetical protein PR202_gb09423 [Eleusine coracana subsp. coracana]|uniref:Uncharacterized protein n=1 Tax=Eleusine coracana subsp. coracana TaxID=191504 RepID=A0AAV5EHI5_ELECO|nr:hypothetical protein PR202_gb09423 [Eleusine coracana subsp. coracana]
MYRRLERSSFFSDAEHDATNVTWSDTCSVIANLLSSSRYSTFSLEAYNNHLMYINHENNN